MSPTIHRHPFTTAAQAKDRAQQRARSAHACSELAQAFAVLAAAPGIVPWDAAELAHFAAHAPRADARLTARFLLTVWLETLRARGLDEAGDARHVPPLTKAERRTIAAWWPWLLR